MSIAVLLVGLVLVGGALAGGAWRIHWLRGTQRTQAEILDIQSREEEGGGQYNMMETVHVARLRFEATDGATVRFEHKQGRTRFRVGDRVSIRYHPTDPAGTAEVPFILNEIAVWFTVIVCLLLGSVFAFAGWEMRHGRGTPSGTPEARRESLTPRPAANTVRVHGAPHSS